MTISKIWFDTCINVRSKYDYLKGKAYLSRVKTVIVVYPRLKTCITLGKCTTQRCIKAKLICYQGFMGNLPGNEGDFVSLS